MPTETQAPIPITEYLTDALRHIEDVAQKVVGVTRGIRDAGLKPLGPRVFGRGCDVPADLLARPFGRGCAGGLEDLVEPRAAAVPAARRAGRARKQVKR